MEKVNEGEKEFRFGDNGPKYLFRGPKHEWGIIVFHPGQELGTHYHDEVEETFFFLEGTPKVVVDDVEYRVKEGDAFRMEVKEKHNIINDSDSDTRIVFIKCPYLPKDKTAV